MMENVKDDKRNISLMASTSKVKVKYDEAMKTIQKMIR